MSERVGTKQPTGDGRSAAATERLVAACENLLGPVEQLTPIAGSTGGVSFIAKFGTRTVHAKLIREDSSRTVSLATEFELLHALSREGLGPKPIAWDADVGVLLTEYLEGYRVLGSDELREPAVLERVCALLSRLHFRPVALSEFSPQSIATGYFEAMGGMELLEGHERKLADELLVLADDWKQRDDSPGLCHGDLVAENFMLGPTLMLVDFEYAQQAPPVLDLASLSVMNHFAPVDDRRMLGAYYTDGPPPFSPDDFAKVRRMVALIAHFWALVQGPHRAGIGRFVLERPPS